MKMNNGSAIEFHQWDSTNRLFGDVIFTISIFAAISHCSIWFQIILHKTKFDLSFIFSLGYIAGDIFVLISSFINYAIRTRTMLGGTRSFCYFEAYSIFIFNLLQSYDLALLNICRYYQIVRNQNIYENHRRILISISIIIPLLILCNLFIQDRLGWSMLLDVPGASCSILYMNIFIRIWNLTIILLLPITTGFCMLVRALYFLKNFHAQQVMVQRNHHHHLIVHSLIFYSIWFVLWSPLIVVIFFDIDDRNDYVAFAAMTATTLEVFSDPFLAYFLDKRFSRVWKKSFRWTKQKLNYHTGNTIHPIISQLIVQPGNT